MMKDWFSPGGELVLHWWRTGSLVVGKRWGSDGEVMGKYQCFQQVEPIFGLL
jgi:hypothetical protein